MNNIDQYDTSNLINKLYKAKNNIHINQCLKEITTIFHCEYYLFAIISKRSMINTDVHILDNYPNKWRNYYDEANLIKHDPIVNYCFLNHSPITWDTVEKKTIKVNKPNVIQEAKLSGLHSGFSFPIHSLNGCFGMISFAHSSHKKPIDCLFSTACMYIPLIIPALLDNYHRVNKSKTDQSKNLTKREKECLAWACEGKSSWETSKILGCSERTVTFHLTNSQTKLETTNRCQSVSKAILTGAMDPLYY